MIAGSSEASSSEPLDANITSSDSEMAPYREIFYEMVDDVLYNMCLKAHRAIKLGYFHTDEFLIRDGKFVTELPTDKESADLKPGKQSHNNSRVICPICNHVTGPEKFTNHLNGHKLKEERKSDRVSKRIDSPQKAPAPEVYFEKLTLEAQIALLNEKCCVRSQKTGRYCKKSLKCAVHSEEQRNSLRSEYQKLQAEAELEEKEMT